MRNTRGETIRYLTLSTASNSRRRPAVSAIVFSIQMLNVRMTFTGGNRTALDVAGADTFGVFSAIEGIHASGTTCQERSIRLNVIDAQTTLACRVDYWH